MTTALRRRQASQASRCAQLPGFRAHLCRERDRPVEVHLGQFGLAQFESQFSANEPGSYALTVYGLGCPEEIEHHDSCVRYAVQGKLAETRHRRFH